MPENAETWVEKCKAEVVKYIKDAYTTAGEAIPEYTLAAVWEMPADAYSQVLFRTNLDDWVRYLVTFKVSDETIVVKAFTDGPMESKKVA